MGNKKPRRAHPLPLLWKKQVGVLNPDFQVVDESGNAEAAGGQYNQLAGVGLWKLQIGLLTYGNIIGFPGISIEFDCRFAFKSRIIAFASLNGLANLVQHTVQLWRFGAFSWRQIAVARRERETIVGSHRFTADDFNRQRQLSGHVAQNHQLLVVLLAENSDLRLHNVEQFEHDGGDAAEMAGTEFTFKLVLDSGRVDLILLRLGVKIGLGGSEQDIDTMCALIERCLVEALDEVARAKSVTA